MLFCRNILICCDLSTFWKSLVKKSAFGVKNSVSWARGALLHSMYCISYWVELTNLQLCAKTTHMSQNSKYALDESFYGHFCPHWKAADYCPPATLTNWLTPVVETCWPRDPYWRRYQFNAWWQRQFLSFCWWLCWCCWSWQRLPQVA